MAKILNDLSSDASPSANAEKLDKKPSRIVTTNSEIQSTCWWDVGPSMQPFDVEPAAATIGRGGIVEPREPLRDTDTIV